MTETSFDLNGARFRSDRTRFFQALLLCCHIAIICVSIIEVADVFHPMGYLMFDARGTHATVACAADASDDFRSPMSILRYFAVPDYSL